MDLQWINSLVLPLLLLIGTMAAFIMVLMLLIDTISFYRRRLKRNRPEALPSPAPAGDGTQKTTAAQAGTVEYGEEVEQGREALVRDQVPARKKRITRILARFINFRSGKSKTKIDSIELAPPSAPILPETPADAQPIVSVQPPAAKDSAVADTAAKGQSAVSSEPTSAVQESDQSAPGTKAPSEPSERTASIGGSVPASAKTGDQSATEADKKPQEGPPEGKEGENDAPKIKLKPLASLEEARKIIESKAASKTTESKAKPVVETDDVASLLGIASTAGEKAQDPSQGEGAIHSKATEAPANKASITGAATEALEVMSNQEPGANSGGEKSAANEPKGDDGEDLTAAEILMMNSGEDEILVLSKQLFELKSSLVQLEKKLKSLKEK
jgi:hypothetical protein